MKAGCSLHAPPEDPPAPADARDGLGIDPLRPEAIDKKGRELCERHYNVNRHARDLHESFESV